MTGVNNDGVHVYEMMNLSSGDNPEHRYGTVNENTEQTFNVVGSDENASGRTTQSSPIAYVIESIGGYHMYANVNENTEIPSNYVNSDENTLSGIHASQAQNGSANTCMKKEYKVVLIISITLVVMAVALAVPLVVFLPRKPQDISNACVSSPCMHDATCVDGIKKYACKCALGYSGTNCQIGSLGTTTCMDDTNLIKGDRRTCGEVFGRESTCVQGKCACTAGNVPTFTNTDCEQGYLGRTDCSTSNYLVKNYTRTCEEVFGAGTTCAKGKCLCSAAGYVPNLNITACVKVNGVQGRTPSKTLFVTNGDVYQDSVWGDVAFCPPGTFATGYMMKIEPDQGNGDDTALNAIRLVCSDLGWLVRGQISSLEGDWGDWSPEGPCHNGTFLVSFKLQVQIFQGNSSRDDDSSVNYVRFHCRDFAGNNNKTELFRPPGDGLWGKWGSWSQTCDLYSAICGLMTRVESIQRGDDDTALNDVLFFCCNQFY